MEEPFGQGRRRQAVRIRRAGRLATDRHVAGVAAEGGNVVVHPAQRRDQIEKRVVARRVSLGLLRQLRMGEEAEDAQPVVHRDQHDALSCQAFAVVDRHRARAFGVGAAVDVDVDRPLLRRRCRGRPHVQVQAVFADLGVRHELVGPRLPLVGHRLHAAAAELVGLLHALPRGNGSGRAPSQVADRRRGKWQPFEDGHRRITARDAGHETARDANGRVEGAHGGGQPRSRPG